jgi:2'-5' RNA ligase
MLNQVPKTIPAEMRDFTEWRRGRETYGVWVVRLEDEAILEKSQAAREYLSGYLLEPYCRQPHITLFVCGFLVGDPQHRDDFSHEQLQAQVEALKNADLDSFEIEIGGLSSFASAPFLEVKDPEGGITRLREILSHGAREFRTAPYRPHLTVGLYAGTFPSQQVSKRLAGFPCTPIRSRVRQIDFSTYHAREIAGPLTYVQEIVLIALD